MAVVAVVVHQQRPEATRVALDAARWLVHHGHRVCVPDTDVEGTGLEEWSVAADVLGPGLDLALSVGGDGTMLRTVDLVLDHDVPVLGINCGRLGYLTDVDGDASVASLGRFFSGDHRVERRLALDIEVRRGGRAVRERALNEAVVEKTKAGHTVRLGVRIGDEAFTTFAADGIIVATPTGSTAYNLSARGPIVSPQHRALIVTPVAPHMLFDRSLVLDPDEAIELEILEGQPAAVSIDGRPSIGPLQDGDTVTCRAGAHDALLVTFGERHFHRILKAKFKLADR